MKTRLLRSSCGSSLLLLLLGCMLFGPTMSATNLAPCRKDEFQCKTGLFSDGRRCSNKANRCDGSLDCKDGSDELDCDEHCTLPSHFNCRSTPPFECIQASSVCDGLEDCVNGDDERPFPQGPCGIPCKLDQFNCAKTNACIPFSQRCDGLFQCGPEDESDEAGCVSGCRKGLFRCNSGTCISDVFLNDGFPDCSDGSDELGPCKTGLFRCHQSRLCIPESKVCDTYQDCRDGSDEADCLEAKPTTSVSTKCLENQFECRDSNPTECISGMLVCNHFKDCANGSDEENCDLSEQEHVRQCQPGSRRCGRLTICLPEHWWCNGIVDCPNGFDEERCNGIVPRGSTPDVAYQHSMVPNCTELFQCKSSSFCIDPSFVCNNHTDCPDGDDEGSHCDRVQKGAALTCEGLFWCNSSSTCIDPSLVCNNHSDCPGNEDEGPQCVKNACTLSHCQQLCNPLGVGYLCSCQTGYRLAADRHSCEDINECFIPDICSQSCINTRGSYECTCSKQYTALGRFCLAKGPEPFLLVADKVDIRRISTRSRAMESLLSNITGGDIVRISVDYHRATIYWVERLSYFKVALKWAPIDNITGASVMTTNTEIHDLDVDWLTGNVYWSCSEGDGQGAVYVNHPDGDEPILILSLNKSVVVNMVLNPLGRFMYIRQQGSEPGFYTASMDGCSKSLLAPLSQLSNTGEMSYDHELHRLYWVDVGRGAVAFLDTRSGRVQYLAPKRGMSMLEMNNLVVFEDYIYLTAPTSNTMHVMDKRVVEEMHAMPLNLHSPRSVKVYHPNAQPRGVNYCVKAPCSHLCALSSSSPVNYTCLCSLGQILDHDGSSCITAQTAEEASLTQSPPVARQSYVPTIGIALSVFVSSVLLVTYVVYKRQHLIIRIKSMRFQASNGASDTKRMLYHCSSAESHVTMDSALQDNPALGAYDLDDVVLIVGRDSLR